MVLLMDGGAGGAGLAGSLTGGAYRVGRRAPPV